jgi:hypothetical protein
MVTATLLAGGVVIAVVPWPDRRGASLWCASTIDGARARVARKKRASGPLLAVP